MVASLNIEQTALAFEVSTNTIRKWIAAGMPVEVEGTNGAAYEIDPAKVTAWRQALAEKEAESRRQVEAASAQVALFIGSDMAPGNRPDEVLSIEDKYRMVQTEQALTRLRREKGDLIPVAEVRTLWSRALLETRATLLGLPDRMAKHGDMSREQRTLVEQTIHATLRDLAKALKDFDVPGHDTDQDGQRDRAAGGPGGPAAAA